MVFSSHIFLYYFLPTALLLYYMVPRAFKNPVLAFVSAVFYAWAGPWLLAVVGWCIFVDYCCGNLIAGHWRLIGPVTVAADGGPRASDRQRRLFLTLSLLSNITLLALFKYLMFAQENLNALRELAGADALPMLTVLLPVGISFYTFESISYTVDIFLGRARPALSWVLDQAGDRPIGRLRRVLLELRALSSFACYLLQFPHLVAGPVIRYQELEAQIHRREHSVGKFSRGVFFLCLGLAKKVILANTLAPMADGAFSGAALHTADAWLGLLAYAFQIYFDFSGYSDMAVGLALMLGFEYPRNFDAPYRAQSITDFWRRWHMSLSTWLRDYLYVPLGGNRLGAGRTYVNLMTVMVIGGLWHGASWNFALWGAIHGVWLCLERLAGKSAFWAGAPAVLRTALTFFVVNMAWVFFRSADLPSAWTYMAALFGLQETPPPSAAVAWAMHTPEQFLALAVAAVIAFSGIQTWDLSKRLTPVKAAAALILFVLSAALLSSQLHNPFLYFQF